MRSILILIVIGCTAILLVDCQAILKRNNSSVDQNNMITGQSDEQSKRQAAIPDLRDLLYCDQSLDKLLASWQADNPKLREAIAATQRGSFREAESTLDNIGVQHVEEKELYWLALAKARQMSGNNAGAKDAVLHILSLPTEARWKLHAWTLLRELGYKPNEQETHTVLGVIVEMGMDKGYTAIVAGYADGDARMLWTSGGGLLGPMQSDPKISEAAKSLVKSAEPTTAFLPIETNRPYPATGRVRFAILTPAGMYVADEREPDVRNPNHRLYVAYMSMHKLLTQLIRVYSSSENGELPKR